MDLNIIQQTGTANTTYSPNRPVEWLVIHYSASTSSKKGAASGMCSWCANPSAQGSADFAVDDETMYQYNGDIKNRYCWAVGGSKYTTMSTSLGGQFYGIAKNKNCISIELSSNKRSTKTMDVTDDDWYLTEATINNGIKLAVYLMKTYNIDMGHVIMHHQTTGKWCPQPWTKNEAALKGWYDFLAKLQKEYDGTEYVKPGDEKYFRVRVAWDMPETQLGAFIAKENAIANCPSGYSVFDNDGKLVYENNTVTVVYPSGIPKSKEDFINKVSAIAIELYKETAILPSVVTAQCCLETGFGLGSDSTELVQRNNLLGMKADLINNTWQQFSVWDGRSFVKTTPEYYNGKLTYIRDEFRVYKDYENCIRDYEQFLLNVQNAYGYKYRKVSGMVDPEKVITAISQGGYATDPNYTKSVLRLINEYNLTKYDDIARNSTQPTEPTIEPNADPVPIIHYVVQVGAYLFKANAEKMQLKLASKMIDSILKKEGLFYKVQVGDYIYKINAEFMMEKLKNLGIDAILKEVVE